MPQNNDIIDFSKYSLTMPDEQEKPETIDFTHYTEVDEESPLPEGVRNTIGGVHSGIVNNSFTANIGTYLESRLPLGRLFSKGKDGEIEFWQSTPEWLGIDEDQWDALSTDERAKMITQKSNTEVADHWQADPDSTGWMLGQIGGMLVDPTTAVPIMGTTRLARTASGAAIGASDVAAYEKVHEGQVSPEGLALGAVLGGAAGNLFRGKTINSKVADEQIDMFNKIFPHQRSQTDDIVLAWRRTVDQMGLNDDLMKRIVAESDKSKMMTLVTKSKAQKMVQEELEGLSKKGGAPIPKAVDKVIQPIAERFKKINPRIWLKLEDQQRKSMELAHQTMTMADPFLRKVEKLKYFNPTGFRAVNKAMFQGSDDIEKIVLEHLGDSALADLHLYRSAMDNIYNLSKSVNPKLGYIENYFPRWVDDIDALKKHLKQDDIDRIQQIIADKADKLKRGSAGLTREETNDIYNKYLQGFYDSSDVYAKPGGTKTRGIRDLPDELIEKAYAKPAAAAHSYIKQMATDIYRKKMFQPYMAGVKDPDNLTDSIGAIAAKFGNTADDAEELKHLLDLLYVQGTRAPSKGVQWFKDMGYTTMLGNPLAALTQIGDIFLAAGKIGTMNTMDGLAKTLTGRGLSPKEFGLMDNVIEELVSTGLSKKILDRSLSIGGFKAVDRVGKATLMNGALKKFYRDVHTKEGLQALRKKWGTAFGKDWPEIERQLANKELNSNIKTMVFSELADIQPITLLEMPEMYLKHPNGRLAYMLRTFSMKWLNLLRRDMVDKFAQGERKQALINGGILIGALNLGGITADTLKDAVLNRNQDIEATVMDNVIKSSVLFNRYTLEKMGSSHDPVTTMVGGFIPPVSWMDPMARAVMEFARTGEIRRESKADVLKTFPVIGQVFDNYFLGGLEEYNRKH